MKGNITMNTNRHMRQGTGNAKSESTQPVGSEILNVRSVSNMLIAVLLVVERLLPAIKHRAITCS